MNKIQRAERKRGVKEFMRRKREHNKSHPDEHELRRLEHRKQRTKKLSLRERRKLKKLKKEKIRQTKRDHKLGLLGDVEFKREMEAFES